MARMYKTQGRNEWKRHKKCTKNQKIYELVVLEDKQNK